MIENNCLSTGCLFSVNVRHQYNTIQQLDTAIRDQDVLSDTFNDDCDLSGNVGYDGQFILNYWNREILIMSDTIITAIAQTSRKTILSFSAMNKYICNFVKNSCTGSGL